MVGNWLIYYYILCVYRLLYLVYVEKCCLINVVDNCFLNVFKLLMLKVFGLWI